MKNLNIFFALVLGFLTLQDTYSQQLFSIHNVESNLYQKMTKQVIGVDTFMVQKNTIFYNLDIDILDYILSNNLEVLNLNIPFFNNQTLDFSLTKFEGYSDYIQIIRNTDHGQLQEDYYPNLKTYKINTSNPELLNGVFIFSKKHVKGVFNIGDEIYQIDLFNSSNLITKNIYFISNIKDSPIDFEFKCAQNSLHHEEDNLIPRMGFNTQKCIEISIEIDYYTFNTFNNYQESLDWALEILAVSSVYYLDQVDLGLKSNFAQIWETEDPYFGFVEDPNAMLYSIREEWINDPMLSSTNRDLVHLFSKRSNTGTGGIAFLNGVGSNLNGYGFSSNLTDEASYVDIPAPYFFWNIYCFMHEIGHNLGSKHTQWCGWPGGPIDNCVDIEEITVGECETYINNPTPQVGTIMSYCHTSSVQSGGGIIMKFHDLVKSQIIDYISAIDSAIDLDFCDNNDPVVGCIDELACNYNESAEIDNGLCIYADLGFDCFGECLNDQNNNGICDEEEDLAINTIQNNNLILYPNPADNIIHVKTDNFLLEIRTVELFNSLGQLAYRSNLEDNFSIDISNVSAGIYVAHFLTNAEIIKETIIIQ